jgi:hypothetical protein
VSRIISACDRLERADGLAAVLGASYEAFEGMLVAFRACEDPDTGLFAAFVMASASAADGRDAVAFAPSFPRRAGRKPVAGAGLGAGDIARAAAGACRVVADRLRRAAVSALDPGDRAACDQAAGCARRIGELLGGAGP